MYLATVDLVLLGKIKEIYDKFKNASIPRLETNIVLSHTVFRGTFKHGVVTDETMYGYVITRNQDMIMYVSKMNKSDAMLEFLENDHWYVFDDRSITLMEFDSPVSYTHVLECINSQK